MFRKMQRIFFFLLLMLLSLIWSCKDNPVTPKELEPGRRDYIWTVDTLETPFNTVRTVWGSSPTDVWAVGPGGSRKNRLWHYDGTGWTVYNKEEIWCAGQTLHGFSADDIWMGGQAGWLSEGAGIWHYDGSEWQEDYVFDVEEASIVLIFDLHGKSPNDLYACGVIGYAQEQKSTNRGFILHYNGKKWKEVYRATWESQFLRVIQSKNHVYIWAYEHGDTDTFYEIKESKLDTVFSRRNTIAFMNLIDERVYFTVRHKVHLNIDDTFQPQWTFPDENFGYQVWGRHSKDVFVRMLNGVAHYNGVDTKQIYTFPPESQARLYEPMIFKDDVFFPMRDPSLGVISNMILHGKLQEDKED
ncbi:MAG: hypothetical protein K9N46_14800 [Candidatus Marinimicrobia bacterium]|nr:hypothetical protein [Candidatus Neomarinimicrobiota bacterium]MCF7829549.1 hypothetical protein [Candidatus Neomarinimicrobiota bacterium]MCF7881999.1 hypothetical protein [Candidatus Neomarinimicrobiota bacterium]